MGREEDISLLTQALNDPAQSARHDQIRAALAKAGSARPGGPPEVRRLTPEQQQAMTHQPGEGTFGAGDTHTGDEVSAGDRRLASFNERLKAIPRGIGAIGSFVAEEARTAATQNPFETRNLDPDSPQNQRRDQRRRQVVRGLDDSIALGYATKAADALHAMRGDPRPYASTAESDQAAFPNERVGAGIAGAFSPGVMGGAMKVAGVATRGLPAAVRPLVGYEATAPALAGLHADTAPGQRLEAAGEAARDPLGLILAGVHAAAAGGGRKVAGAIRAGSPDLQALHEYGLEPGPVPGRPVIRENQPIMSQLPGASEPPLVGRATPATRASAARVAADVIEPDIEARSKASNQRFGQLQAEVYASEGQNPAPFQHIVQDIDTRLADQRLPDPTRKALGDVRAKFEPYMGSAADPELAAMKAGLAGASPQQRARLQGAIAAMEQQLPPSRQFTARDLDEIRDYADSKIRTGEIKAGDVNFIQLADSMRKTLADPKVGPGIAALNAQQSEILTGFGKRKDLLGMEHFQRGPGEDVSEAMARRIAERGEETKSAGARTGAEGHAVTRAGEMGQPPVLPGTAGLPNVNYKPLLDVPRLQLAQENLQVSPSKQFSGGGRTVPTTTLGLMGRFAGLMGPRAVYPLARRAGESELSRIPTSVDAITRVARDRGKKKKRKNEESTSRQRGAEE